MGIGEKKSVSFLTSIVTRSNPMLNYEQPSVTVDYFLVLSALFNCTRNPYCPPMFLWNKFSYLPHFQVAAQKWQALIRATHQHRLIPKLIANEALGGINVFFKG
ncbi:uncharacterized protein LOC143146431 isoform X2 [Ptiloglossa arizonensis]|uniref:uncharacterized protein LOC143146431 isoform X2 n=1 Tax=Ptiloglossa arizonensis TaxID=3350558 RepID=UPI003F9EBDBF